MHQQKERKYNLFGWVLFVISAFFFIAASLKTGDPLGLAGGLLFLAACGLFLVPLGAGRRPVE